MSEMICELTDAELDAVAAGGGVPNGKAIGFFRKVDVDIAAAAVKQTQSESATVTQSNTINKSGGGPLIAGKDNTLTLSNTSSVSQTETATGTATAQVA